MKNSSRTPNVMREFESKVKPEKHFVPSRFIQQLQGERASSDTSQAIEG